MIGRPRRSTPLPSTRPFRSHEGLAGNAGLDQRVGPKILDRHDGRRHARAGEAHGLRPDAEDRKSTRLNSSHANISYAVFCLKKKTTTPTISPTIIFDIL